MCFFKWSCSVHIFSQTLNLNGILKVKEGGIIICKVNKQLHLTHLWNYHHLMRFLECTLVMCFFKLSCSEHDFHKPCIWMIDSSYELLCMVFYVREGDIIIIYEVKTCTSHTWKLPIWNYHHFMCLWECTLVMCFFKLSSSVHEFHKPLIWMVSSHHELFLHVISKVKEGISSPSTSHTWKLHIWNYTHVMCFWECTLCKCFFKWFGGTHNQSAFRSP